MKKLIFATLLMLILPKLSYGQTQVQIGWYFQWDYNDPRLNHFEINTDFVEWQNIGKVQYWQIPSMQASLHTFYVRACPLDSSESCSDPLSMQFIIINPNVPNMPSNLRASPTPPAGVATLAPAAAKPTRLPSPPGGQAKPPIKLPPPTIKK